MEISRTKFRSVIFGMQLLYIVIAVCYRVQIFFIDYKINLKVVVFEDPFVWTAAFLFLFIDGLMLKEYVEKNESIFFAIVRGITLGAVMFYGGTLGAVIGLGMLLLAYGFGKKKTFDRVRGDILIVSTLVFLEIMGLLRIADPSAGSKFLEFFATTWPVDILLLISLIIMGKRKIWEFVDENNVIRIVARVVSILIFAFVLFSFVMFLIETWSHSPIKNSFLQSMSNYRDEFFTARWLTEKTITEKGFTVPLILYVSVTVILIVLSVFMIGVLFKDTRSRIIAIVAAVVTCFICGILVYPVLYAIALIIALLFKYSDESEKLGKTLYKRYIGLIVTMSILVAVSVFVIYGFEVMSYRNRVTPQKIVIEEESYCNPEQAGVVYCIDERVLHMDKYNLTGWAFIYGVPSEDMTTEICLVNTQTGDGYVIYTEKIDRDDVESMFGREYLYCGFKSYIPDARFFKNEYDVVIRFSDKDKEIYVKTGEKIRLFEDTVNY